MSDVEARPCTNPDCDTLVATQILGLCRDCLESHVNEQD